MAPLNLVLKGTDFVLRSYSPAADLYQVRKLFSKDTCSREYAPDLLPQYATDVRFKPYILEGPMGVVAFVAIRNLSADTDTSNKRLVFVEAVRVREDVRGAGLGTELMSTVVDNVRAAHPEKQHLRILATTVFQNEPMRRVFQKTGWTSAATMLLWPSDKKVLQVINSTAPTLEALGVANMVSPDVFVLSKQWKEIRTPSEILAIIHYLRDSGSEYLRPDLFTVEGAIASSRFLCHELAKQEGRSVWRLTRGENPAGLLFVRPRVLDPAVTTLDCTVSACIDGVHEAESAVVFAASREELPYFRIIFDNGMTPDMIATSPMLSLCGCFPFLVYECTQ
ncbi:hypothetical protein BWQ96_05649 [Gracilariopsis chorda]|uniref:N-acetyltransferase domain-containing protein n=1 Tax=Gracilariopsis chorda TaxID=448386 RepID=A0A2V3IR27_9FLOR|nr:hypothetical protein BWQ96_05649 [Gracilariopsis chorda]|eukprot:PXF44572.1 hypothetical protein BWQ96_05649 [Gracilariopsis chorda]